MCIEEIKREIKSAQTYYNFWNSSRHLPTAAQTADYFASRLKKLKEQLNEYEQKKE
jgi:hypothetical protein